MPHTSLALLKAQLNIEHDLDNTLLEHKLAVAEEWIGSFIGRPFFEVIAIDPDDLDPPPAPTPVPASLTEAAVQLSAYWYVQREAASDVRLTSIPFGVIDLLRPYREAITGHVAVPVDAYHGW